MPQEFEFEYVLTVARRALSPVSNFTYGNFADAVLRALVQQQAIAPPSGPLSSYHDMHLTLNQRNPHLERRLVEVFYYMFHRGFFIPEPNPPNAPLMVRFYMTERGYEWLQGADPMPEEGKSYMEFLSAAIPNLDRVVRQYVQEALIAYDRQAWVCRRGDARGRRRKSYVPIGR
jgi:hypothetical protein